MGNGLGSCGEVGHGLNGPLQIVPIAGGIIWARAKAFVWTSAEHLDGVVVAVDFEQEIVRRAPGIDKAGKRRVLLCGCSFESGLIREVAAGARGVCVDNGA